MEESQKIKTKTPKKNPWIISTIVLALTLIIVAAFGSRITGNVVSESTAESNLLSFISAQGGGEAKVVSAEASGPFYKFVVEYQGQNIPVLVTLDGSYLVSKAIPLVEETPTTSPESAPEETPAEIPKSDKPKVELFVMTHCPYGTQAEKGIIPAIKALGSAVDAKIRFVHYFMHGDKETQETYTQVCIREEQSSKFLPYLECFLEDSNSTRCLAKASIDKSGLTNCMNNKAKTYYAEDSALSNKYKVQGSPTLVINEVQSGAGRSPASYLLGICSAFNSAPSACNQQLSSAQPSPGFGTASSPNSAGSAASCG